MFSVLSLSQVWYQYLRIRLQCRRPWFDSWVRKIHCRRDRLHTPVFLGFLHGLAGKESACNVEHWGSIPGLGRSPREGNDYPLQYSGLENSMDCIVHWVAKSRTWQWFSLLDLFGGFPGGPITSWEIDGETVETVSDFILGGSKITADGDCSHEIKDTYFFEGKLWPP